MKTEEEKIQEEYEAFREDFRIKYGIDVDLASFKTIRADEARGRAIQAEAAALEKPGEISTEESNAKCHCCSAGLSYLEHMLYGNRCVFCADQIKRINVLVFITRAFVDWLIYNQMLRIKSKKGSDGRFLLSGYLGYKGYTDINQVNTINKKTEIWGDLYEVLLKK